MIYDVVLSELTLVLESFATDGARSWHYFALVDWRQLCKNRSSRTTDSPRLRELGLREDLFSYLESVFREDLFL